MVDLTVNEIFHAESEYFAALDFLGFFLGNWLKVFEFFSLFFHN